MCGETMNNYETLPCDDSDDKVSCIPDVTELPCGVADGSCDDTNGEPVIANCCTIIIE